MNAPRFSIIPAGAVTDRSLEPRDLQVLCLLGRHTDKAGWCARSQVKMAQEIDCSRGSVQNSLDRLSTAGWIEMKRRDTEVEQAGKQPSRAYAYRVLLDRDDYAFESVTQSRDDDETDSHAETASDEGGCQPVGTPGMVPTAGEGVPTDQHPGATPYVGTRANPYDGTKNVPLEQSPIERERDARARDRKARFLVDFEARWPTAAADDRQRTAYAADALTEAEQAAALAGIAPFLENLKRLKRDRVPAGWRYLEEKRWTLLEQAKADTAPTVTAYPRDSVEAVALRNLHDVAGCGEGFRKIYRGEGGSVNYRKPMTEQIRAFARPMPPNDEFVALTYPQSRAWEEFFAASIVIAMRWHPKEGDRAPWPWPPSVEGKVYTATGPPNQQLGELSDAELADFK